MSSDSLKENPRKNCSQLFLSTLASVFGLLKPGAHMQGNEFGDRSEIKNKAQGATSMALITDNKTGSETKLRNEAKNGGTASLSNNLTGQGVTIENDADSAIGSTLLNPFYPMKS
jgi:hypothetical protein